MPFATPVLRAAAHVPTYKSAYGPKYHFQPNFAGITQKAVTQLKQERLPGVQPDAKSTDDMANPPSECLDEQVSSAAFGGAALIGVLFLASGIPRLQRDVLEKIPGLSDKFRKEIPASDNANPESSHSKPLLP
ncbi:hypothetical protein GQ53DRAFT_801612 [Thozetella sp. PMI_491]|nr:hypothetical protein GQ53DRAFT_801612 [Thozetella sp. PMI_491]